MGEVCSATGDKDISRSQGHWQQRVDLAAAFRWIERLGMNEAVANHFSLAVTDDGSQFLMNPNQMHFAVSGLLTCYFWTPTTATPWLPPTLRIPPPGVCTVRYTAIPHARCVMHVHSIHATVLASLADSTLPPIDQNTAMFYGRHVVDDQFGGLAFEEEGTRCATLLGDPNTAILVMGNHGVLAVGPTVADTLFQLFYFERAAETYIRALQTGQPLRIMSPEIAQKTADELADYPGSAENHLQEIKHILDDEGSNYAS